MGADAQPSAASTAGLSMTPSEMQDYIAEDEAGTQARLEDGGDLQYRASRSDFGTVIQKSFFERARISDAVTNTVWHAHGGRTV